MIVYWFKNLSEEIIFVVFKLLYLCRWMINIFFFFRLTNTQLSVHPDVQILGWAYTRVYTSHICSKLWGGTLLKGGIILTSVQCLNVRFTWTNELYKTCQKSSLPLAKLEIFQKLFTNMQTKVNKEQTRPAYLNTKFVKKKKKKQVKNYRDLQ